MGLDSRFYEILSDFRPVLIFVAALLLERCIPYSVMGFDWRKDSPPAKEIMAKFGFIKFPRTLFTGLMCLSTGLPMSELFQIAGFLFFGALYFIATGWDVAVSFAYIKQKS
jgi:hypothetical protein